MSRPRRRPARDPLDVRCPVCAAAPGESCAPITVGRNRSRTLVHHDRAAQVIQLATEDNPGPDGSVDVPFPELDEG